MDTKPRSSKILKMQQNDLKINFDSTGTKTSSKNHYLLKEINLNSIEIVTPIP